MLEVWLDINNKNTDLNIDPEGYSVTVTGERNLADSSRVRSAIRGWLRHCYASSEYIQSRVAAGAYNSAEELYQKEKFPNPQNVMVRHGDFGEAVGHFLLEAHPDFCFWLPIFRLRSKDDPDKSHFGFDLMGFGLARGNIGSNVLCIGEAKLRTSKDKNVIAEAHGTLASYSRAREIEQTGRIAHQLFEQGKRAESDKLAVFGEGWAKEDFERRHIFIGVFDEALPIQEMLESMEEIDPVLPTFSMCIVLIDDLRNRIEEAYKP